MNYEEDIKIDETDLDIECLEQPVLMLRYIKHASQTEKELDEAKQSLDIVKAEVDRKIRETPEAYGIEGKVTEGAINSAILTEDAYQEAQKKYLEVKFERDMAKGAVTAFTQRKDMLESLIKLFGLGYFAGPKVPRDLPLEVQRKEKQSRVNRDIGESLSRNPKR